MSAHTRLRVGRLVKAHGLKGAFKLELYTDDPDHRFVSGARLVLQVPEESPWYGKDVVVSQFKWMNAHPVVFFEGITDRTQAETLVRAILWMDVDTDIADDNTWYDHQLVGLTVLSEQQNLGTVTRVDHLPAHDLLVVDCHGREVLVPFVAEIVPTVDIDKKTLQLTPPPGLFDDGDDHDSATTE